MRAGTLVVAGLLMWTIASAARSYSRAPDHFENPAAAVDAETAVPAPVMSTLRDACFDCHSNETRWPWYSSLPIVSWLIEHDVSEGRGQLNFSYWQDYTTFERVDLLDKVCDKATKREMPLWQYRFLHRSSRLNGWDVVALCAWSRLEATRLVEAGS
jgi:heme-binding protein